MPEGARQERRVPSRVVDDGTGAPGSRNTAELRIRLRDPPATVSVLSAILLAAGGAMLCFGASWAIQHGSFGLDSPQVPLLAAAGAALVVGAALRLWLRTPAWRQREIRFGAEQVELPRLGVLARPCSIRYDSLEVIATIRRSPDRSKLRLSWAGGQLAVDLSAFGPAARSFLGELSRRSKVPVAELHT